MGDRGERRGGRREREKRREEEREKGVGGEGIVYIRCRSVRVVGATHIRATRA